MTGTETNEVLAPVGIDYVPEQVSFTEPSSVSDAAVNDHLDLFRCNDDLDGWQDFELLPPSYRARRHSQHALHRWSAILLVLLSVAIGSSVSLGMRGRRTILRNAALVEHAEPLRQLRQKSELLEMENVILERWCQWVESAKPDHGVVQILGAVALATHPDGPVPQDQHLDVQSIEVKLPLEYDTAAPHPPTWAAPKFALTVKAHNRDVLMPWNDRMEMIGRLKDLKINAPSGNWQQTLIQVGAVPLSTKVVP